MDKTSFVSRLKSALAEERRKLLDQELKTDFAILKRQRNDESVPPNLYWAIKCLPEAIRISYINCLAEDPTKISARCSEIKEFVSDLCRNSFLTLEEWAKTPTVKPTAEQIENIKNSVARRMEFYKKAQYYEKWEKSLC